MNFSVFNCTKEDSVGKPLYNRFVKTNDFKGVPHPLSGDYTPIPQEEIDESLYVYGKKGPQELEPNVSDDRSSEYSTCQSNDSAGSIGTSSEHSVDPESEISSVPPEVYVSTPITTNEKGVSDPKSKEVEPSCVSHIKTPRQPIKDQATPKVNRKNWNAMMERELGEGYSFTKKKCFVCGSLSHLIKDCDYYEKKMAREAEFKKQRVFNTGNGVAKPVWTNANRVNHANKFVPRSVQLNAGRPNINSVRPNINTGQMLIMLAYINTGSSNVILLDLDISTTKPQTVFSSKRPQKVSNREYSNARTSQQNGVAERMNRTLIEAARTMLADSLLPTTFWAEAVNTLSVLGKFDGKSDEGFLVDKPNVKGVGYRWMFDIDYLTDSMNYIHVSLENQANPHAGASVVTNNAGTSQTPYSNASEEKDEDEILIEPQQEKKASSTDTSEDNPKILAFRRELEEITLKHLGKVSENTSTSTPSVNIGSESFNTSSFDLDDSPMPELEIFHKSKTRIFDEASYDEEGVITTSQLPHLN
ncbi:ribonuclease H-like domain-containing protein [Tanacetum coccineum]